MKLPRNLSAQQLIRSLSSFGYAVTRQVGSHIRLTTLQNGEHHLTVPNHNPLRVGTLASIVTEVANHLGVPKLEVIQVLFGN